MSHKINLEKYQIRTDLAIDRIPNYDEEDYDNMVNSMLEFAFDGYETIKPSALQNNSQLSS